MSSSLINSAMSGLSAAQTALNTVSNNISNYNVTGYSRQTTILSQASSTLSGNSWIGNGVNVSGVQREYDQFITTQLRQAQNQSSALSSRYDQVSQVDDLFSSTTSSISTSLQSFFSALTTLNSNASDSSAREALIGQAQGLVNQFKTNDTYLRNMDSQVNSTITSDVAQINTYTSQIANLNQKISEMTAQGSGASPNDLLDQRDQLVSDLNKIVGVNVTVQDGSTYNLTLGNGTTLVQGSRSFNLAAVNSSADPSRTTIAYVDPTAGNVEIPESQVTTGSLGGLLTFRTQDLDSARNSLGQLALSFADAFNTQHTQGYDANGDQGTNFFTIGAPSVLSNSKNTGSASLTATVTASSSVQATNYNVAWSGSAWTVTRASDNTTVTPTVGTDGSGNTTLAFEGLSVTVTGTPAAKDSFTIKPVSNAVVNMSVAVTDESKVALASSATSGQSDNTNSTALLNLQNQKLVAGNKTFNDAYASLVSQVGNTTSTLNTTNTTQTSVVTQLSNQQQSVSGVNLDEEYANLQRYQQYYQANAQVLQTASTIFNALLSSVNS